MSVYDKSEGASLHFDVPFFVCAAARGYSGSAMVLFRKRLALILEEPGSYFGSARLLFGTSQVLP